MYILNVLISEDRNVYISSNEGGAISEKNAVRLDFTVPEQYKDYIKYLDILKENGEKLETVMDVSSGNEFSYVIPSELTDSNVLHLQLVMKKEDTEIFKSYVFQLFFKESINADVLPDGNFDNIIQTILTQLSNHIKDIDNPHSVTKEQLDLGNVDNTSDKNKPISIATQNALDTKVNISEQIAKDNTQDTAISDNTSRIDLLFPDVADNTLNISNLKKDKADKTYVDTELSKKVNQTSFDEFKTYQSEYDVSQNLRIDVNEKDLTALKPKVTKNTSDIAQINTDLSNTVSNATFEKEIFRLDTEKANRTELAGKVDTFDFDNYKGEQETKDSEQDTSISDLSSQIQTISGDISNKVDNTVFTNFKTAQEKNNSEQSQAIMDVNSKLSSLILNVEIEKDGFGNYTADYNDNDINNFRNAGGVVQAKYYDSDKNQTYTYYYSTMESDRKPTFIRTYIEDELTKQVLISVDNAKKVTVVTRTAGITQEQLATKVDKELGKGLSSNDFTTEEKNNVAKIPDIEKNVSDNQTAISGKADKIYVDDNFSNSLQIIKSSKPNSELVIADNSPTNNKAVVQLAYKNNLITSAKPIIKTTRGITFKYENGKITAEGTATAGNGTYASIIIPIYLQKGLYTVSMHNIANNNPEGTLYPTITLANKYKTPLFETEIASNSIKANENGKYIQHWTIKEEAYNLRILIAISTGKIYNISFDIQLEAGIIENPIFSYNNDFSNQTFNINGKETNVNENGITEVNFVQDKFYKNVIKANSPDVIANVLYYKDINSELLQKRNFINNIRYISRDDILYGKTKFMADKENIIKYTLSDNEANVDFTPENLPVGEKEYTFYAYVIPSTEIVPLTIKINGKIPSWIEEPLLSTNPTLFAFQTLDGGNTWVANQCYEVVPASEVVV